MKRALQRRVLRAEIVRYEGAGHSPHRSFAFEDRFYTDLETFASRTFAGYPLDLDGGLALSASRLCARPSVHGSWLNLVEGFFSKLARSVLRHIRVASKQELKHRIMAAMDEFNRDPVVHTWSYRLDLAA